MKIAPTISYCAALSYLAEPKASATSLTFTVRSSGYRDRTHIEGLDQLWPCPGRDRDDATVERSTYVRIDNGRRNGVRSTSFQQRAIPARGEQVTFVTVSSDLFRIFVSVIKVTVFNRMAPIIDSIRTLGLRCLQPRIRQRSADTGRAAHQRAYLHRHLGAPDRLSLRGSRQGSHRRKGMRGPDRCAMTAPCVGNALEHIVDRP